MLHFDRGYRNSGARLTGAFGLATLMVLATAGTSVGQTAKPASEPAWKTSPYHGVIDGDGNVIPCRCLFRGTSYRLGEKVCMNTYLGTVMTECDLQLNNTSWVPTAEACTIS